MTPRIKAPFILTAATAVLFALAGASAPQAAMSQSNSSVAQFGEVKLQYSGDLTLSQKGPRGAPLIASAREAEMTSARYDMAAQRIQIELKNGVVTTGTASGSVIVTVRNPEQQTTTQLTCDTARYTRQAGGAGRIDMTGNVHSKTYSPQFAKPLINDSKSATATFGGSEGTEIKFTGGSMTVTPVEPPAAAPAKK